MKKIITTPILLMILAILASSCSTRKNNKVTKTYSPVSQSLYDSIVHMDSILFNAFNGRDLETLKTLFTEDLEFYHDNGGLSGYEENMENFKNNFAKDNKLNRKLVKGSTEVFPIKDYGAIQIGMHTFCHIENGKEDCGTFKFLHVWQNKNGWKISRVISYDH